MRLSWLVLAFAVLAVGWADETAAPTSTAIPDDTTTVQDGDGKIDTTTSSPGGDDTDAPVTDGPKVTDEPEKTDDPDHTAPTVKTTPKSVDTTTLTTTTKKATVTTPAKEPEPDVENFSVKCDKVTEICTYSMQIPGLDIDTFNDLMLETNQTETEVLDFEDNDLVNLQAGVTKVFDDAKATADYVENQLTDISKEIADLETQSITLQGAVNDLNVAVYNANASLNKILAKKGSCLYRMCILREQTTTRPATTTTTKKPVVQFCDREENKDPANPVCKNGGTCNNWYDSFFCTCIGNLDGQDNDCSTSVCDIIKTVQLPGPIYSPGYNGTTYGGLADDDCDGASWIVKTSDSKLMPYLTLEETSKQFTDNKCIANVTADSNLQLTVGKYKLKITSKTKYAQIIQILGYGYQATISYSGPAKDFFHFTLGETNVDPNTDE